MPPETLPTIDVLKRMDDLSGPALYQYETRRITPIPRDGQAAYVEAARAGDEAAAHRLILNCLNWTMRRAYAICRDDPPEHSDMMDLVGHANQKMVEAMPKAIKANDPVAYFMSVSAQEMRRYCVYNDPLIQRQRDSRVTIPHPATDSLEAGDFPLLATTAAPDAVEASEDYQALYDALDGLSVRQKGVLMAAYGLGGQMKRKNQDIAAQFGLPKETIEKYLWRAKRRLAKRLGSYAMAKGLNGN